MKSWKDNISFILIEPKEPGNIGASARALKNMGFKNLELISVNPVKFLYGEARCMACNAVDVLEKAKIRSNLEDAIKDKSLIIGTTGSSKSLGGITMVLSKSPFSKGGLRGITKD